MQNKKQKAAFFVLDILTINKD